MPELARLHLPDASAPPEPAWLPVAEELQRRPRERAYAIDPANPLEIDDAIKTDHRSDTEHRIGVFICDMGLIANETRALELARARGWTRYDDSDEAKTITMFDRTIYEPLGLDQKHFGIGAPALKIGFSINPKTGSHGEVVFERVCVTTEPYSYEQFDRQIALGSVSRLNKLVETGEGISQALKGHDLTKPNSGVSKELVARFMVMANFVVAEEMEKEGVPWLYRNHGVDAIEQIRHISTEHKQLFKKFMRAVYQDERVGHEGLGLGSYCHLTSGLRRFPDTANGLNLDAMIDDKKPVYNHGDMAQISDEMTEIYRKEMVRRTRKRAA